MNHQPKINNKSITKNILLNIHKLSFTLSLLIALFSFNSMGQECTDPLIRYELKSNDCVGIFVDFIMINLPENETAEHIVFAFTTPEINWEISPEMEELGFTFTTGGGIEYHGPPLPTSILNNKILATYNFMGNAGDCTGFKYNFYYTTGNGICPNPAQPGTFKDCILPCEDCEGGYYFSAQESSTEDCCIQVKAGSFSGCNDWTVIIDGSTYSPNDGNYFLHCPDENGTYLVDFFVDGELYWSRDISLTSCGNCNECEDFEVTPPSFTYQNILDSCFIEFDSITNAIVNCPGAILEPGYYTMNYGDNIIDEPADSAHCDNHEYKCDGIYEACLTYHYTTSSGKPCDTSYCETIEISGCNDCCTGCEVDGEVSEVSTTGCFATVCNHVTSNDPCIELSYLWTVDGKPVKDNDPTFSYQFNCNGTYEICGTVIGNNPDQGISCMDTDCVTVTITDCEDCPCDIAPPTNLQVKKGALTWDEVPNAEYYIISSPGPYDLQISCNCKQQSYLGKTKVKSTSYSLSPQQIKQCFVWRVQAVCKDGTISDFSKQHCYPELDEEKGEPIKGPGKFWNPGEVNNISIYPNPTTNHFKIDLIAEVEEHSTIQLIDQSGRVVATHEKQILKGNNQFNLSLTDLARGVYMVKVSSERINQYKKLVLIK